MRVMIVIHYLDVFVREVVNRSNSRVEPQRRQLKWHAANLLAGTLALTLPETAGVRLDAEI